MCVGTHFHEPKKESKADFLDKLMLKACKEPMYGQPRRPRRISLPFPCKRYSMLIVMRKVIIRLSQPCTAVLNAYVWSPCRSCVCVCVSVCVYVSTRAEETLRGLGVCCMGHAQEEEPYIHLFGSCTACHRLEKREFFISWCVLPYGPCQKACIKCTCMIVFLCVFYARLLTLTSLQPQVQRAAVLLARVSPR